MAPKTLGPHPGNTWDCSTLRIGGCLIWTPKGFPFLKFATIGDNFCLYQRQYHIRSQLSVSD
jgi:hypothetical protein